MPDELLDRLGNYFVRFNVRGRMSITFERFVELYQSGQWKECAL